MLGRLLTFCLGVALCHLAGPARADNCRYLEMQLMQLQGSSSRQAEAGHVRAMLRDRGCTGQRPSPSAGGGSFRFDFNSSRERPRRDRDWFGRELRQIVREPSRRSRSDDRSREDRGTYRTLCVRSCDGYYFPISFSTTQDRLPEDARACEAMCPGTEAKLFFHDNPGGGPENMTALDGQAYTSLATAFRYRTALSDSCTCRPAGGYSVAVAPAAPGAPADPTAPLPRFRPAPDEDPETLANRAGSFTPGTSPSEPVATASVATSAAGGSIRLVGPPHWSSQEQDSLVLTPVPN